LKWCETGVFHAIPNDVPDTVLLLTSSLLSAVQVAEEVTPVETMEIEGPIHFLRLDLPSEPEPWTYAVSYAPHGYSGSVKMLRRLGRESLKVYLEREVGILPKFTERALEGLEREGSATIPTVRLTRDRLEALGLL